MINLFPVPQNRNWLFTLVTFLCFLVIHHLNQWDPMHMYICQRILLYQTKAAVHNIIASRLRPGSDLVFGYVPHYCTNSLTWCLYSRTALPRTYVGEPSSPAWSCTKTVIRSHEGIFYPYGRGWRLAVAHRADDATGAYGLPFDPERCLTWIIDTSIEDPACIDNEIEKSAGVRCPSGPV